MPPRLKALRLLSPLLAASRSSPHPTWPLASLLAAAITTTTPVRHASILSSLSDNRGAYSKRIKRGRGPASGKGKTAGRGQKGQHAHGKVPAGFQGGQTPLSITTPERGRNKFNPFTVDMTSVNLDRIQQWVSAGRLDPQKLITIRDLKRTRCVHGVKPAGVKLLARSSHTLTSPVHLVVSRASASAIAAVEAAGGSVTTRFYSPVAVRRVLRGTSHPVLSLQASPKLREKVEALGSDEVRKAPQEYAYRLPDATGRRDLEYYRDTAHRGYLTHLVQAAKGETASLYFRRPVRRVGGVGAAGGSGKAKAKGVGKEKKVVSEKLF